MTAPLAGTGLLHDQVTAISHQVVPIHASVTASVMVSSTSSRFAPAHAVERPYDERAEAFPPRSEKP